jgi:molybdopterin/thiamine biosynthesis adenylyltransferase
MFVFRQVWPDMRLTRPCRKILLIHAPMTLSSQEIERYARQIVLHGVGGPGQNKLKAARALVIGAGGLGSPALQYLAGAGVGTLGIVDDDSVSLSNLHRQVIHATDDVGQPKTDSAQAAIARINPHVAVEPIAMRLDAENAHAIIRRFDVVLDGSDNFATRYALSDACFHERRPLVSAALGEFDGTLTTLKPYEDGPNGKPNPTYRCLFPDPPEPGTIPTCAEAGVLGALAGALGSLMALEAIRVLVGGFGDGDEGLVGRLLMIDTRAMRFETLRYGWDPDNVLSGRGARSEALLRRES